MELEKPDRGDGPRPMKFCASVELMFELLCNMQLTVRSFVIYFILETAC